MYIGYQWKSKCGANANTADSQGNTALFTAVSIGYEAITVEPCQGGVDANKANHHGETPLYPAVRKDCVKAVAVSCELGEDVNTDYAGVAPLTIAAKQLRVESCYRFLFL